eukprot:TRINITY_DN2090_c0_g1_i1.p1 TRINITY_DN2090_c0_g1~~TRINITY_DN2090_c0_g1_i1.p1  ORF type:complete len:504 (-),score=104.50 TRINITY_DN2090_c0_g1_i1:44-1510(-)
MDLAQVCLTVTSENCDWIMENCIGVDEPNADHWSGTFVRLTEMLLLSDLVEGNTELAIVDLVTEKYNTSPGESSLYLLFRDSRTWVEDKTQQCSLSALRFTAAVLLGILEKFPNMANVDYFRMINSSKRAIDCITKVQDDDPNNHWILGSLELLKARKIFENLEDDDPSGYSPILEKAQGLMRNAYIKSRNQGVTLAHWLDASSYKISRAFALDSVKTTDCFYWLVKARMDGTLPEIGDVISDPFFQLLKDDATFRIVLTESRAHTMERTAFYEALKSNEITPDQGQSSLEIMSQSAMLRAALSKSTLNFLSDNNLLENFFKPVRTGRARHNEERLKERMKLYGLETRRKIPGDGNCQMYSLSDQLCGSLKHATFIRRSIIQWLRANADLELPNGAIMRDFVHDKTWERYCNDMARSGSWGDHLTLIAAGEIWKIKIFILSSVEGDNYIIEINPEDAYPEKMVMLSHYAEYHYGSIQHVDPALRLNCI